MANAKDDFAAAEFNPFRNVELASRAVSPVKVELTRKIEQMNLGPGLRAANATVRELTVKDLNDLAASFAGVKVENERVNSLSTEDVRNIEEVFLDFKLSVGERISGASVGDLAASVDVSCCCCTPCCCCAAAVTEPVSA